MPAGSDKNPNWSHLAWGLGGIAIGKWLARSTLVESKKSRAERDYPDEAKEAYEEIGDLLDQWKPSQECKTEDDFTHDLADYLTENSDLDVEVYPDTEVGKPDILIDDLIALELKVSPKKSEQDRCIGQCADYSRLWITWMVIIDASGNTVGRLERVLKDRSLDHIQVWDFH